MRRLPPSCKRDCLQLVGPLLPQRRPLPQQVPFATHCSILRAARAVAVAPRAHIAAYCSSSGPYCGLLRLFGLLLWLIAAPLARTIALACAARRAAIRVGDSDRMPETVTRMAGLPPRRPSRASDLFSLRLIAAFYCAPPSLPAPPMTRTCRRRPRSRLGSSRSSARVRHSRPRCARPVARARRCRSSTQLSLPLYFAWISSVA